MNIMKIDGQLFKSLVLKGAENLKMNYQYIDSLNVFPVPDGDTGTNMALTFMSAAKDIAAKEFTSVSDAAGAVAKATAPSIYSSASMIYPAPGMYWVLLW